MKTWMCFPGSLSISKHVTSRSRQRHQDIAHKTKDHLSLLSPNTPAPSRATACQDPVPCLAAQPRVGLAVFFPKGTVTLSASGSKTPLVNVRSRCKTLLLQAQALAREHFESVKDGQGAAVLCLHLRWVGLSAAPPAETFNLRHSPGRAP